jgi:adenylate cyclase
MATGDVKRKLTAIFSADVEGYSRLMEEDELATVETLTSHKEIMRKLIRQYRGRVVDSTGDNLLAEFSSVVDAVQCAVEVQQVLNSKNEALPENRKMFFRIGINSGDVIEEGDLIYGDGVNVAARVESLAEGGGISISGTAYDQLGKKLPLGYEYLGEQSVKNIEKPVRVYRVLPEAEAAGKVIGEKRPISRQWRWAAVALIVVAAALAIWNFYFRPQFEPASVERMAFPLPDKPSLAVLPFDNLSGDPKQEYLSDGITESIISAVSRVHNFFVIARNSTFAYKGKAVKVQQVAEDLGVQYVLEGSIQKSGDKLRITVQLIDALNGRHIWSQRYDRKLEDLFTIQDDITMEILQAMRVKLIEGEQILRAKRPKSIDSALKAYEAQDYVLRFTPEANDMGRKLAEELIDMEPDWGEGYYILSEVHMMDVWLGMTKSPMESLDKAIALSEKAVSLDDSLSKAFAHIGYLYAMKREHDKSVAYAEEAVAKDPNGADAHAWLGNCLRFVSRVQEAITHYEKAMRLNPRPPQWYYINLGIGYNQMGRYEEAASQIKKALALRPNSVSAYSALVVTYGIMGKEDEARTTAEELLRINPHFSAEKYIKAMPYKDPEYPRQAGEALRKAGLK